ncbi:hypothetical protein [Arthrobacter sp. 24S4-2]|uniref:hypothetical protein n=1 Tax=Arthrobacter sp. 24S4-2 TaxID=2575374 RepID=UPI001C30AE54|nr:hypothetical protein [Arthrobacter sp. 24S4-2]
MINRLPQATSPAQGPPDNPQARSTELTAKAGSVRSRSARLALAQLTTQLGGVSIPSLPAFQVVMGLGAAAVLAALAVAAFLPGHPAAASGRGTGE